MAGDEVEEESTRPSKLSSLASSSRLLGALSLLLSLLLQGGVGVLVACLDVPGALSGVVKDFVAVDAFFYRCHLPVVNFTNTY